MTENRLSEPEFKVTPDQEKELGKLRHIIDTAPMRKALACGAAGALTFGGIVYMCEGSALYAGVVALIFGWGGIQLGALSGCAKANRAYRRACEIIIDTSDYKKLTAGRTSMYEARHMGLEKHKISDPQDIVRDMCIPKGV